MATIDEIHLELPFYGARRIRGELRDRGFAVGRDHVTTLMRKMDIAALYPSAGSPVPTPAIRSTLISCGARTSPAPARWCADVTYLPMARGFCYLVAIMDWASRRVLAWRLSNTLDASFCVEALRKPSPLRRPGDHEHRPGSQFTSEPSPAFSPGGWPSAWTAGGAGWTTSSSSGCGEASSTRRSTSRHTRAFRRPEGTGGLLRLLQQKAPAPKPRRPDPRPCLLVYTTTDEQAA